MTESEHLLQLYAIAQAPSRDYYGLTVTTSEIILNVWNISHGPHLYPKRYKSLLEDFLEEKFLQEEIRRNFGNHVLDYCGHLANKGHNLQYLPTKLFLRILGLLAARDILSLSQTSKIFFQLCNTDTVWKIIFRKKLRRSIVREDCRVAENIGWKKMLMNKFSMRLDIKRRATKTNVVENRNRNNSTKTVACKQNNIDIIENFKRPSMPKISNDVIRTKELSTKEVRKQRPLAKTVTFKNETPVVNAKSSHRAVHNTSKINLNLHITASSITNHLNTSTKGGNLRPKSGAKVMPKKK